MKANTVPQHNIDPTETLESRIARLENLELLRGAEEDYAQRFHAHQERGETEQMQEVAKHGQTAHEAYQRGHLELRQAVERRMDRRDIQRTSIAS